MFVLVTFSHLSSLLGDLVVRSMLIKLNHWLKNDFYPCHSGRLTEKNDVGKADLKISLIKNTHKHFRISDPCVPILEMRRVQYRDEGLPGVSL